MVQMSHRQQNKSEYTVLTAELTILTYIFAQNNLFQETGYRCCTNN